ncbi:MAG: InlB B-repeat-containing protein [Bdellovibrionaceae bacterium]|nr:InlB B-repeat-containing protein [Pseudobdellovibrionaceae bacterium]
MKSNSIYQVFIWALAALAIVISGCGETGGTSLTSSKPAGGGSSCSQEHSITYDANGATGGTAPTDANTYASGSAVTMPTVGSLAKTYHSFLGWNTAADGTGTNYAASASLTMPCANVTLFANWDINSFYVATTGNDTTGDGSAANPYQTVAKGLASAAASATKRAVRVAAGTYSQTAQLSLGNNNIQLLGGYDSNWNRDIAANETILTYSSASCVSGAIRVSGLTGTQLIEGITLTTPSSSGCIGIYLSASPNTSIRRNKIIIDANNGTSKGIRVVREFTGTISGNFINLAINTGRYVDGITFEEITSTSEGKIENNVINVAVNPYNDNPSAIKIADPSASPGKLLIRNNTFILGTYQSSAAVRGSGGSSGAVDLSFDNNIAFLGKSASNMVYGIYSDANVTLTLQSFKNNNLFLLSKVFNDLSTSESYTTVADLETAHPTEASGNISVEMKAAGYFTDPANGDWRLSGTAPTSISEGGLDGSALSWGFSTNLLGITRTGNGITGWSMGAY